MISLDCYIFVCSINTHIDNTGCTIYCHVTSNMCVYGTILKMKQSGEGIKDSRIPTKVITETILP